MKMSFLLILLFVALPAKITSLLPESVSVLEGEDIRIPCQSIGAPQPEIFWQVGVKVVRPYPDKLN